MSILIISSYLPYPLFSGGHIRLYNLVRELSKNHTITLICERRDYQTEEDVNKVGQFCKKIITVPRKKQWTVGNVIRTGFSLYPFLMVGHTLPEMKERIALELKKNTYDIVHVETFYVMHNLPEISLPTVLAEHNIEYLVYKRFTQNIPFFLRPLLLIDVGKMKYWEEYYWRKATVLIAVSEEDKKIMARDDAVVVPNGVDIKKYQISNIKYQISKKEKTILFIGDFRWIQNRDAAAWLLKEIWPHFVRLRRTLRGKPKIKLWIVGKNIPDYLKQLSSEGVLFDENASEDAALIYQQADVLLAPIRVGGGTSFKILEAMASGVPVVTTKLGIEGIDAKESEDVLIADSLEDLVEKVVKVLEDERLYAYIGKNARTLIEEKYAWEKIVKRLEEAYRLALFSYD